MCQTDVDYLARKERTKDLLRAAERERLTESILLKQAGLRSSIGRWLAELAAKQHCPEGTVNYIIKQG
jgi:hypothetical protein